MNTMIKPIETIYKGYRFRSRLEARWAVFFDTVGVKYEYEPEGYDLGNGIWYLPDFFLPELNIFVEIKPSSGQLIEHHDDDTVSFCKDAPEKYRRFTEKMTTAGHGVWFVFGDPYDALINQENGGNGSNELFFIGTCMAKLMQQEDDETCICNGEEKQISGCENSEFACGTQIIAFGKDFAIIRTSAQVGSNTVKVLSLAFMQFCSEATNSNTLRKSISINADQTLLACYKAREARFEHGDTPGR